MERQIAGLRSTLPNPEATSEAEAARTTAAAAGAAAGEAVEAAAEGSRATGPRPGTLTVRCPEPGLKLVVDGKRIDLATSTRGLPLTGGAHRLVLSAPGRRSAEESLEIPEGGAALVICENLLPATTAPVVLPGAPGPPGPPIDIPPVFAALTGSPTTPTVHAKTVAYLLGGLGVALGGTAIGVYFWNRSKYEDLSAEHTRLTATPPPTDYDQAIQYNADVDSLRRNSILTVGLAVTSVGLLAGGAYLYLYERRSDGKGDSKPGDKTGQVGTSRRWASVTPGGVFWNGVW